MRYATFAILCITIAALSSLGAAATCLQAAEPAAPLLCEVREPESSLPATVPADRVRPGTEKIDLPEKHKKRCPETGYVNCMPPVSEERRERCNREYIEWMKEHCPGAKVVY